jgi:diguanylate cyclase (GGDEF)-like protein/PAS domain S-box-containing protein
LIEPVEIRVVVVGIDETDLQKAKQWPLPDRVMAQLLQKIQTYQPRGIGLDIYRDLPVEPGHGELLKAYKELPDLIGIEQIKDRDSAGIPPPPILGDRGQVGFNNLIFDADGKVRRGLLYWTVEDGKTHESLILKLSLRYLKGEGITPQAPSNPDYLQLGNVVFRQFEANDGAYIQADDGGYQILGNLRGAANAIPTVSMTDLMEGRVPPEVLRDRVVLIGSTAISLKDFFYTSYSHSLGQSPQPISGVELQAQFVSQVLSAVLDGRGLINVWADPLEWLWIVAWSWLGAKIVWKLRSPYKAVPMIFLAGTGLVGIAYTTFVAGWWIPLVPPLLGLTGSAVVILAILAHLEEELKRSKEFLNSIINTIPDPIFVKDSQHRWIVLNQAYCRFLGRPLEDVLNRSDYDVFPLHEAEVFHQQDQQVFDSAQEHEHEEEFTDQNGTTYHIATKRSLHKDAAGNLFLVGVIRDITERKQMEDELKRTAAELVRSNAELAQSASQLRHLANHDTLTGLPNRKLFEERLGQALEWAQENSQLVALLFLDLDGFKLINDTQGHDIGDLLLKAVARRLTGCLRSSDTVSRLGGDEFTVILPAIPGVQDAGRVAEKILTTLSNPFEIEGHTIFVTISIGISLFPQNGEDAEMLVKEADNAMYQAKELGKNRHQFAPS